MSEDLAKENAELRQRLEDAEGKIESLKHKFDIHQGAWIERKNILDMFNADYKQKKAELEALKAKVEEFRDYLRTEMESLKNTPSYQGLRALLKDYNRIFGGE